MTSGSKLLLLAHTWVCGLGAPGSVLMSIAYVTTRAHENHVFNHVLKYKGLVEQAPPLTDLGKVTHSPES